MEKALSAQTMKGVRIFTVSFEHVAGKCFCIINMLDSQSCCYMQLQCWCMPCDTSLPKEQHVEFEVFQVSNLDLLLSLKVYMLVSLFLLIFFKTTSNSLLFNLVRYKCSSKAACFQ